MSEAKNNTCALCDAQNNDGGGMFWNDERWICSVCWDGVAVEHDKARIATLRSQIVIKDNNVASNDPCAICGDRTDPNCGPELFLEGTWALVCHHNCGSTVPGLLDRLKQMQKTWWDQFRRNHGVPDGREDCRVPF